MRGRRESAWRKRSVSGLFLCLLGGGRKKEPSEELGAAATALRLRPPPPPPPTTPTAATPAASCAPRPRVGHLSTWCAPALRAAATVASLDPPSTTTTKTAASFFFFRSRPRPRSRRRFPRSLAPFSPWLPSSRALLTALAMLSSSLSAGMMTASVPTPSNASPSSLSFRRWSLQNIVSLVKRKLES